MFIVVDPVVLALPNLSSSDAIKHYVEFLVEWHTEFKNNKNNIILSDTCVSALQSIGHFPSFKNLQSLWVYCNDGIMNYTDCKTLFGACMKVFANKPYLEERIKELGNTIVDESTVSVVPDLITRYPEQLSNAVKETLGYIAYAEVKLTQNLHILTHPIEGSPVVIINARVMAGEALLDLEATIPLISKISELTSCLLNSIDSWEALINGCKVEFSALTMSESIVEQLQSEPFSLILAKKIFGLLSILNELKLSFDTAGNMTDESQKILENFFWRKNAIFSDESYTNKNHFESQLTFRKPGDSNTNLFCPWHGKIHYHQFRLHFSWPIKYSEPVYVVYIGPKITKQ